LETIASGLRVLLLEVELELALVLLVDELASAWWW
jgi:hypothetical protein